MERTAVVRATTFAMRMGKRERELGEKLWGRDCEELGAEWVGARSGGQIFDSGNGKGSGRRMKSLVLA